MRSFKMTITPTSISSKLYYNLKDFPATILQPEIGDQIVYTSLNTAKLYVIKNITTLNWSGTDYYECFEVVDISGSGGGASASVVDHTLIIG